MSALDGLAGVGMRDGEGAFSIENAGEMAGCTDVQHDLLRSHQERGALARRIADKEKANQALASQLRKRAEEYEEDADLVRKLLKAEMGGSSPDRLPPLAEASGNDRSA